MVARPRPPLKGWRVIRGWKGGCLLNLLEVGSSKGGGAMSRLQRKWYLPNCSDNAIQACSRAKEIALSHPHNEHRAHRVEKSRVHRLTKGYAHGGAVKGEKAIGKKSLSLHRDEHRELDAEGEGSKHRMDRPKRAKGGRVKGNGKTI